MTHTFPTRLPSVLKGRAEVRHALPDQFLVRTMPRPRHAVGHDGRKQRLDPGQKGDGEGRGQHRIDLRQRKLGKGWHRSEEHTSELQSLMRTSYAVLCSQKQNKKSVY